jgi:hypothetical protein
VAALVRGATEALVERAWKWSALAFVLLAGLTWAIVFPLIDRKSPPNPEGKILPPGASRNY